MFSEEITGHDFGPYCSALNTSSTKTGRFFGVKLRRILKHDKLNGSEKSGFL